MDLYFLADMIVLFGVGIYLGVLLRGKRLTERTFAFWTAIFWSVFFTSIVFSTSHHIPMRDLIGAIIGLAIAWGLLYPLARWLYRQVYP